MNRVSFVLLLCLAGCGSAPDKSAAPVVSQADLDGLKQEVADLRKQFESLSEGSRAEIEDLRKQLGKSRTEVDDLHRQLWIVGNPHEVNDPRAAELFDSAADKFELDEPSKAEAVKLCLESAKLGYAPAQVFLSEMKGHGVDSDEANNWLSVALRVIPANAPDMLAWLRRAEPKPWFAPNRPVQHCLGEMFFGGYGVKRDHLRALKCFLKDAKTGCETAMFFVARIYSAENTAYANSDEAIKWLKKSAQESHGPAQFALAECYRGNVEFNVLVRVGSVGFPPEYETVHLPKIEPNIQEARRWMQSAANLGDEQAQHELARMYGYDEDFLKSAASDGDIFAIVQLETRKGGQEADAEIEQLRRDIVDLCKQVISLSRSSPRLDSLVALKKRVIEEYSWSLKDRLPAAEVEQLKRDIEDLRKQLRTIPSEQR